MDNIKAIELKGIVRNQTKIGAKDGTCADLVNLRFRDGSWRTSGNGKQVYSITQGSYTQLYIHTGHNYRHLLGVNSSESSLVWFANVGDDGETFTTLQSPVNIIDIDGTLSVVQNGNLLIVKDNKSMYYLLFKDGDSQYIKLKTDEELKDSRDIFPFGGVHFNVYSPNEEASIESVKDKHVYKFPFTTTPADYSVSRNTFITAFGQAKKKNLFTRPFLAVAAIKMYDGSYLYASNPQLIYPRQTCNRRYFDSLAQNPAYVEFDKNKYKRYLDIALGTSYTNGLLLGEIVTIYKSNTESGSNDKISAKPNQQQNPYIDENWIPSVIEYGTYTSISGVRVISPAGYLLYGSDLVISVNQKLAEMVNNNKDIFKSICIFVTPEVDEYDLSATFSSTDTTFWSCDIIRSDNDILYDLIHSNFYLLKEYSTSEVNNLINSCVVDIDKDSGLDTLVQNDILTSESFGRTSICPNILYMYNGRLHVADYEERQYHGYPTDLFNLNNQNVKIQNGSYYKGVLKNLVSNGVEDTQWTRTDYSFPNTTDTAPFAIVRTKIETSIGYTYVVRYIPEYNLSPSVNGRADFLQSLDPLIIYPDSRATEMTIYIKNGTIGNSCTYRRINLSLKPHPILNIAYFLSNDFKPINFSTLQEENTIEYWNGLLAESNNIEQHSNYLRVSKVNNPLFFPSETTYQIGSTKILAIMSNAVALGIGQTGQAPLYVFCKDGIYALFVDSSGELAYTNSRIIARDVLSVGKSVTPIDGGVVFITERGLMSISGNNVIELGQPAEGEVKTFDSSVSGSAEKILYNAFSLQKIAELPIQSGSSMIDGVDFLTYINNTANGYVTKINYNNNLRELIVSNKNYPYSYVLDNGDNWSRRNYTADEYINNYPTSYRLCNGVLFKVDKEQNYRDEADNGFFVLSNIIKLDSIGFKHVERFIVRGEFETANIAQPTSPDDGKRYLCLYVFGSYDGNKWSMLGGNEKTGKFNNIGCIVERTSCRFFRFALAGKLKGSSRIDYIEIGSNSSMLSSKQR